MVTQKIQTSTNVKGFTLVELIVVITILVILGTIAFLNLGGMSAGARDSQRTSDLNQINQQIMTNQAKSGLAYMSMVSGTGASLTGATLAGTGVGVVGTSYAAGNVGYTVLGIDQNKFKDPSSSDAYKMGATSLVGTAYELAAKLEESKTALVMGTYRARTTTGSTAVTITVGSDTTSLTIDSTSFGKLKLNDIIKDNNGVVATVNSISADLSKLTVSTALAGPTIFLATGESAGLIATPGTSTTAVTNGGANLPY